MSTTTTFSPLPSYLLGALCLVLGLNSFLRPSNEYPRFGLPFESAPARKPSKPTNGANANANCISPLIHLKGIRETSYGLALIALQLQRQETAVTTMAAICAFAGLGDAVVVWRFGNEEFRKKAMGHGLAFLGFGGWALWRVFS
ncbi:hypothetical protein P170DRAFT_472037 [Aspergillus steynii IBT 23096]|uniref:Uncharacterized protein n=1 Tax=Aspergillus steynii IBT 23096 TaxID=1392250 RepID=A0A2I2GGW9_9EURO|nr:uncharacterized protein P170DRAFT_472037 [Aspergillus steynii IBT 23096]PLB52128.1 hypothetical protein P170DRAFT_472037 [Aspergillus steynii IBT 23096]